MNVGEIIRFIELLAASPLVTRCFVFVQGGRGQKTAPKPSQDFEIKYKDLMKEKIYNNYSVSNEYKKTVDFPLKNYINFRM